MARINTLRVSEIGDYSRDIKGKRLIRLDAGVYAGKNKWFCDIAEANPNLKILLITSRKNIVDSQMGKLGAVPFTVFDELIDVEIEDWEIKRELNRVICTNASIEKFFKYKYDSNNPNTFLWNRFDLIVLDEAHALTTDATFTDCFYTERFLYHTYSNNKNCDIVYMSGTQFCIDWLFERQEYKYVHKLNFFDKCVHLEPKYVYIMPKIAVIEYIYRNWKRGERLVYFANYKIDIAYIVNKLIQKGIPQEEFGFSFNLDEEEDDNETKTNNQYKFPKEIQDTLNDRIDRMNTILTTEEKVPQDVKILFSTSKNKEGININDDDIKITVAETHNRADLIQIAGRVRGNPDNGQGIDILVIVSDARQFINKFCAENFYHSKNSIDGLNQTLKDLEKYYHNKKKNSFKKKFITDTLKDERLKNYVRYDYIADKFMFYDGRSHGEQQYNQSCNEFKELIESKKELFTRYSYNNDGSISNIFYFNLHEIFKYDWFKYSSTFNLHKSKAELKEMARNELIDYLKEHKWFNVPFLNEEKDYIIEKIHDVCLKYGYKTLDIKVNAERLGDMLKKFELCGKSPSHNSNNVKYLITDARENRKEKNI